MGRGWGPRAHGCRRQRPTPWGHPPAPRDAGPAPWGGVRSTVTGALCSQVQGTLSGQPLHGVRGCGRPYHRPAGLPTALLTRGCRGSSSGGELWPEEPVPAAGERLPGRRRGLRGGRSSLGFPAAGIAPESIFISHSLGGSSRPVAAGCNPWRRSPKLWHEAAPLSTHSSRLQTRS